MRVRAGLRWVRAFAGVLEVRDGLAEFAAGQDAEAGDAAAAEIGDIGGVAGGMYLEEGGADTLRGDAIEYAEFVAGFAGEGGDGVVRAVDLVDGVDVRAVRGEKDGTEGFDGERS